MRGSVFEIRELAASLSQPLACLKFAGDHDAWRPFFGPQWVDNPVGWFMTTTLQQRPTARLAGDALDVAVQGNLVTAQVRLAGGVIASGRAGLAGAWCVPDRVWTSERHRRKGLGRAVMQALLDAAMEAGSDRAVLDASVAGRALYSALGWSVCSPQFGLTLRPAGTEGA